jgi:hypothetical protein
VAAATLYVIPGSHPAMAARLMLELKGIEYRRVDLMPVISRAALKALRFPGVTVPALKLDDRRVQGSVQIARELDRLRPEPPLFPGDAELRTAVEEAERWGAESLQGIARRTAWNAIRRDRSAIGSYIGDARLGIPIGVAVKTSAPIIAAEVGSIGPPTRPRVPTSPRFPGRWSASTTGSRRDCWAPTPPTPPTSRSRPACA